MTISTFVRSARPEDALEVRRILDAAMLEPGDVDARIDDSDVFVAGDRTGATERILGTAVLEPLETQHGAHLSAIGVRRRHRGNGLGRRLVERSLEREGRLTARFDDGVRPFYDSLGFTIESVDEQRYRGVLVER
ncbi:GNAT family N-acetyltransferase [Natronobacterium gregoryi]|uniref:Acetyltransferase n=2 Tax=Natronobacterium gregoryi TaxID=44930 RepID=L0AIE8_NATGS|nr:GNAT family N-acetyltransferase [Natronobacterium gregoryi]AFZ72845.1 acetyltransferase [Natronobacterium gregoryi SP2]ELY69667.1 GCN5-related N-acetyltransferase [Natronobacterium gregoryi SP2]PLK21926.1 N-acetyltransferase [Natronobacterium gregoryi SP2]SFI65562.1 Ribosomal protein S18 acetylase RimI [Natronobacterium gregoryi]